MMREAARRQLARDGWLQWPLVLLPVLISRLLFADLQFFPQLAMPLFCASLLTFFFSLARFTAFKHALIATERALDTDAEPAAWADLRRVRRRALIGAALPAWLAAIGVPLGLEPVAQWLLVVGSLALLLLYRIPRQLD